MNKSVKSTLVLLCICAAMAILLAVTNSITSPIIAENQAAAANQALLEVMPNGKDFQSVDLSSYTLPATVKEVYKEANGGYVVNLLTAGYGSGFSIMCGVNADGTVSGTVCLASSETLGYEKTYGENFVGKNSEEVEAVSTVSGATKTTGAYKNAVKDAINAAIILGGGSVDLRSEAEILADNLKAALPDGDTFTKAFITEELDGIDAVYYADNGSGLVAVIGETFVGVTAEGAALTEDSDLGAKVVEQTNSLKASAPTEIDLTQYTDLPTALISASKTESGNYVLDLKGAGYGINGGNEYHPASGEYIYIKVSMTKEGKILDCITVSQAETPNIGSVCAEESFYGQFVGKTEETYNDIDAINGATLTTDGYKKAILRAFESVKIMEGGAENE